MALSPPPALDDLIDDLDALLHELREFELENFSAIAAVAEQHRLGAANLLHYSCLRRQDRRKLQTELSDLGVTSLATTEPNVEAKVLAARNALAALRGDRGPWPLATIVEALDEGDRILDRNSEAVFGPMRPGRPTRIMVTLPSEAADEPELVTRLVQAGTDVARINCAHDDPGAWAEMVASVRAASIAAGRDVKVSMDLPGPKLRTGPITDGPAVGRARVTRLKSGRVLAPARIWFTSVLNPSPAPVSVLPARRPTLPVQVDASWLIACGVGDVVTMRDVRGPLRRFKVTRTQADGMLAEGDHNAYIEQGVDLWCRGLRTTARGIPALVRTLEVNVGDQLVLTDDMTPSDPPEAGEIPRIGCTLPAAVAAIRPGDPVLFDDGAIAAVVESVRPSEATLRIVRAKPGGQHLGAEKGINLPDTLLPLRALTPEDETHLPFITALADIVAVSFVRTADDVTHLLHRLAASGGEALGVILKIETRQGFENLPAILLAAMQHPKVAVMVARGDLAVEIGFERLAEVPRQILALCEAAHVPSIWATQVLENLAKTGQASRAEITDAAAGQRSDCVMLNKGPYIADAIGALDDILARMGKVQTKSRTLMRHIHSWDPIQDHGHALP